MTKVESVSEETNWQLIARARKFFCKYCGAENKPDAAHCEGCGTQL